MLSSLRIIHERSISINNNFILSNEINKCNSPSNEYSLKQNFFDPTKSSPPNEFMKKLKYRMCQFNASLINDDNLDSE
jgi:hypothetical protein